MAIRTGTCRRRCIIQCIVFSTVPLAIFFITLMFQTMAPQRPPLPPAPSRDEQLMELTMLGVAPRSDHGNREMSHPAIAAAGTVAASPASDIGSNTPRAPERPHPCRAHSRRPPLPPGPWPPIVDVVYTFVDDSDPDWQAAAAQARLPVGKIINKYRNWNELRFSMRSVYMYAPWVGRIFLVVASPSQVPAWLNALHERIRIVYHEQIFDNASAQLPTFNSLAIETVLHRIETLSNHFLYINNDVFIGRPLSLSTMIAPHSYKRYLQNWRMETVRLNPICLEALAPWNGNQPKPALPLLESRRANECTRDNQFFWDRALASFHWNMPLEYWFAHIPHLWERRVMYAIEKRLAEPIAVCSRNKWRDAETDVSMNIQFESWLLAQSNKRTPTERRVIDLPIDRPNFYHYSLLPTPDIRLPLDFAIYKPRLDAEYQSLDRMLGQHPQFVSLEDDLKTIDEREREYHRSRLESLMAKHWPTVAPWEIFGA